MKFLLAILSILAFSACTITPQQATALAGAAAGNVYATAKLNGATPATQAATIKALTDLETELPQIPLGKVSTYNLGALQAELVAVKATLITDQSKASQIDSFIALVANNQGSLSGGIVTADQALVFGAFQNVATGIANAIQFYDGQHGLSAATVAAP
jgi:hypothetical protein